MIALPRPTKRLSPRQWLEAIDFQTQEALSLLTVVLLLTATPQQWYLSGPLAALCGLAVVYRRWLTRPQFWYVVATLLGTTVYLNWESSDNHKYLFVYWCLALCGAFSLPQAQQQKSLATSSRWIIGLCMLLAVIWKLAMPDYRNGSFFEFTLLVDERFAHFTSLLAGIPLKTLADNRVLEAMLREGHLLGASVQSVSLGNSAVVQTLAWTMTWWTVLIEGLLAAAFLIPDRRSVAVARNALLLLFAATTYLIAPVRAFGWILMLLGLAQCGERERAFRPLYLAAIVLIQIYTLPVAGIIERLTG